MLHHGKHAPVPTILRPVSGIKFEVNFVDTIVLEIMFYCESIFENS